MTWTKQRTFHHRIEPKAILGSLSNNTHWFQIWSDGNPNFFSMEARWKTESLEGLLLQDMCWHWLNREAPSLYCQISYRQGSSSKNRGQLFERKAYSFRRKEENGSTWSKSLPIRLLTIQGRQWFDLRVWGDQEPSLRCRVEAFPLQRDGIQGCQ